jgi:hypothetical protein
VTFIDSLTLPQIYPDAIYHDGQARLLLGLPGVTLDRARREGRLRYARQGGKVIYRGAWLLAWLEAEADSQEARRAD